MSKKKHQRSLQASHHAVDFSFMLFFSTPNSKSSTNKHTEGEPFVGLGTTLVLWEKEFRVDKIARTTMMMAPTSSSILKGYLHCCFQSRGPGAMPPV